MAASPSDGLHPPAPAPAAAHNVRQVAVIDVGTTSIRMAIAEIDDAGGVRTLETLSQAVNLGRDTFTTGGIRKATIEECVRVLKSYRRVLAEYQITESERIRVVTTSAVREATNRLAFLDRIYIATGLEVDPIDEAEVNRVTYLGVQPFLQSEPALAAANTIVLEVGGGSTELLLIKNGNVIFAHTYRLGSLRLRQAIDAAGAPSGKVRKIIETQTQRFVDEVLQQVPQRGRVELMALGGDIRFAASQLLPEWDRVTLARIPVSALAQFTNSILSLSDDRIMHRYHLGFPEAEALGPALLTYLLLAQAYDLAELLVTTTNLRDGLLHEMAVRHPWSEEFRNQIVRSAIGLGRRFAFDEPHATQVAELGLRLFRQLQAEHRLDARYEVILYVAALLHEIGGFVSNRSLHKHSMYLIRNSEVFGMGRRDLLLVSLVARYHRRASPQPTHEGYAQLDRHDRVAVAKMAAILRVAIALDDSRSQRIQEVTCSVDENRLVIEVPRVEDLSLEQLALQQGSSLFEETYGLQPLLRISPR